MAGLVWRNSDDAGAIIENVYKFCMEEKKSGMKLSLNRVWDRTEAVTDVSRSAAQKIVEEKKKAQDEQQQPKATTVIYVESVIGWLWPGCCTEGLRQYVLLEEGSANTW